MLDALARAIATSPGGEFWIATSVTGLAAGALLFHACRTLSHKRLIEDTPTSRLRAAAQGYVELVGTARVFDGEPIVAPLSGRRCCWYRYSVERREHGRRGHDRARWQRIDGGESTHLFMLDDDSGRCAIDPEGATVTPSATQVWYGNTRVPPRLPGPRRGRWSWLFASGGDYRYREELIEIGAPLYALGFFRTHGGAATPADTHADVAALLREWKSDRAALLARFDADRDGEIDATEWEQARRAAATEVARTRAASAHAPPAVDLLARPPLGDRPFLLAARHEDELTGRHGWAGSLGLVLGTAAAIALAWAVATRVGAGV
ncbi:MAG: GIDE domain-containing protein [Gammaproteobacteria bacterium]